MREHEIQPLPADVKTLIDAELGAPGAPPQARERILSAVERLAGFGDAASLPSTGDTTALAPRTRPSWPQATALKGMVAAFVVGSAGGAFVHKALTEGPARAQPPPHAEATAVAVIVEPPAPPPPLPAVRESAPAPRVKEKRERLIGSDTEERSLVSTVRTALQRGDAAQALTLLDEHHTRFPHGQHVEEAAALHVLALSALDRDTEAKDELEGFIRRYPESMFRSALEQSVSPH